MPPEEHKKREDCATIQRELYSKSDKNKEKIDLMIGERNSSKLFLSLFAVAIIAAIFTIANAFVTSAGKWYDASAKMQVIIDNQEELKRK